MLYIQAVEWWERAAQEATERGAPLEALRLFGRAAALADALAAGGAEDDKVSRLTVPASECRSFQQRSGGGVPDRNNLFLPLASMGAPGAAPLEQPVERVS